MSVQRIVARVGRALEALREAGEMPVYVFAFKAGYSPEYFRRAILPLVLELYDCVRYNKNEYKLVWVCDGVEGGG